MENLSSQFQNIQLPSFKKSDNAQGVQSWVNQPDVGSTENNSASIPRTVQNGSHVRPQLHGTFDAPIANATTKSTELSAAQRSTRIVPKAPTSQTSPMSSDPAAPTTPAKAQGDVSEAFAFQFGSISPGFMNGMAIPARTSSALPNLDEQQRDQMQNPSVVPMTGLSVAMPFHQSQASVQFGGPNPQIQSQGMSAPSLPMPLLVPLPIGNAPQDQQPVSVSGLQPHPMHPQGIMDQGRNMSFTAQMGHQLPHQLGNMGISITPQYPQQQGGKSGGQWKTTVKITPPETHEELRLNKQVDVYSDGGLQGARSHTNAPSQSSPVQSYAASDPINYYPTSSYNTSSLSFPSPSSGPLTNSKITPNSQRPRFNYPVNHGQHNIGFMNPSLGSMPGVENSESYSSSGLAGDARSPVPQNGSATCSDVPSLPSKSSTDPSASKSLAKHYSSISAEGPSTTQLMPDSAVQTEDSVSVVSNNKGKKETIMADIAEALMCTNVSSSRVVEHHSHHSPGRIIARPGGASLTDCQGSGVTDDDRWSKVPSAFGSGRLDAGFGGNSGFQPGQGSNFRVLRNPRAQAPLQYAGGILSGPMQSLGSQGGMQRNNPDGERWQHAASFQQRGLIPSPQTPLQMMHKAEKNYEVGKVTVEEEAKQRQLKAILKRLTPRNIKKVCEQVKAVNIDNAVTLAGVTSQIFEKALTEPIFCEMYADFCEHLAEVLPDFTEDNEKMTFKRLLINKCQEEFERGEREQEANKSVKGEVNQSAEEGEEKRTKAGRRMLGNIRLIGELYKKKILTERIMHECIQKLLGWHQDPDEEDIEALCTLMSTIGEIIDHPKAKDHINSYFEMMKLLSNNMSLSSRVRFMLKDVIDLRKNKWQQKRKVQTSLQMMHRA